MDKIGQFPAAGQSLRWLVTTFYLLVCAVQDIRWRKIGIRMSVFAGFTAIALDLAVAVSCPADVPTYIGGLLPGTMLLLLAIWSGGAAGSGDGICFLVLGALLGTWMTWTLLMCALVLAGTCGAVLMLFRKAGRKTRMPFLAFAAAAWAGVLGVRLSGITW